MKIFQTPQEKYAQNLDEEMLYGIVASEMAREVISHGLYAKALAASKGDESKARAAYITMRVEMLRSEREAKLSIQSSLLHSEIKQKSQQDIQTVQRGNPSWADDVPRTRSEILGRRRIVVFFCLLGGLGIPSAVADGNPLTAIGLLVWTCVFGFAWYLYSKELAEMPNA